MSQKTVTQFLQAVAQSTSLRNSFKAATNSQEFIKIAEELGYAFTTEDLKAVIKEYSEEGMQRRQTGIWPWLRSVSWF